MRASSQLKVPSLEGVVAWLGSLEKPIIDLQLARHFGGTSEARLETLRQRVHRTPLITKAFASQRADGSWGEAAEPARRVLPTLRMAKVLAELGAGHHAKWTRAAEFLVATAHGDEGVFAIDGHRDGVLSCYVGVAAATYLLADRADLAQPQIEWILRYQDVRRAGVDRRVVPAAAWSPHLATRYGGCMADTTCMVGLIKVGHALELWSRTNPADADVTSLMHTIRDAFVERRLIYTASGDVLPLGVVPKHSDQWLLPTFPLDWRTDLIEVLNFVVRAGAAGPALQPALEILGHQRLADGTWPLRRAFVPDELAAPERRSARRGSPLVTLRVLSALWPLAHADRPATNADSGPRPQRE